MQKIQEAGKGVLLYMRHSEGNSIIHKLRHLKEGAAVEKSEQRDFGVGAQILRDLGVRKIRLLTRNPKRRIALDGYGLEIVENIALDS